MTSNQYKFIEILNNCKKMNFEKVSLTVTEKNNKALKLYKN